jgi:hypothetical protein
MDLLTTSKESWRLCEKACGPFEKLEGFETEEKIKIRRIQADTC